MSAERDYVYGNFEQVEDRDVERRVAEAMRVLWPEDYGGTTVERMLFEGLPGEFLVYCEDEDRELILEKIDDNR